MSGSLETERASEADRASASWVFEQIALRNGLHADRPRIRRAVDEAAMTYSGRAGGGWWRWVVEAGTSLAHSCRVLDGEIHELVRLAQDGMVVMLRSEDGRVWHVLKATKGRKLSISTPAETQTVRTVSPTQLEKELRREGFQGMLRCVVVESSLTSENSVASASDHGEKKPLQRLLALLKAESSDIWVVLVFALVSGMLSMTTPLAVESLVNTVAFGRFMQPVVVLSLMLLAFLLFQAAMKLVQTYVVEIIQCRLFARVAADLSFRLPRTRMDALDEQYAPELVNRFFDVVLVQKISAQLLLDGITLVLTVAVGMVVLAFYHPYLLAFDIVLILMLLFMTLVLGHGAVTTSIKESKSKYAMAAWLEELARCRTAFRYDGAAEFALERSDQLIYNYLSARKKHFKILIRQIVFILLLEALASTTLLVIGGWLVISGQLSLGQLVAAQLIVAVVVGSMAKLGKHVESFYDLMASIDKLGVLLDLPIERTDGLLAAGPTKGIVVENLGYSLPDGREVLQNVSFTIRPGQRVALSGTSGSGKSLLLDILFGLREPLSGMISVDGVAPQDFRPDVLRRFVALARDVESFDGTVAENVHLERPDISVGDVRDALEVVEIQSLVQALPQGMETPLTSSGTPLTTSQLQRLMVARAIVGRPEIVLIDEVLDRMADEEGERILKKIMLACPSSIIVLVTGRERLKAMMDTVVELNRN